MKHPIRNRILSALLVLAMVISLVPVTGLAVEETATWIKVELADIQPSDTVMVTMTNPNSVTYALYTQQSGSKGQEAKVVTVGSDGATVVTGNTADYGWNVTPVEGGYTLSVGGKYLYTENSNNGVRIGDTAAVWSVAEGYLSASDGTNTRYLGVYDNNGGDYTAVATPNWRAYKNTTGNTKGQTLGFWKLSGAASEEPSGDPLDSIDKKYSVYQQVDAIADGDTVVLYNPGNGKLLSSAAAGYKLAGVDAAPAEGLIASEDKTVEWVVSVNEGVYTFTQGELVLGMVQSGSYVNLSTNAADGNTGWKLEASETAATWYLSSTTMTGNYGDYYLEYYNGFTAYGSNSPSDAAFGFVFHKLVRQGVEAPEVTEPSVPETTAPTEPSVPEVTEPETPTVYAEKLSQLPADGDTVIIYNSGNAMGAAASGKKLSAVAAEVTDGKLPVTEEMAQLLVSVEGETYIFTLGGKYLTSADTGNGLSFADTLTDCGKWTFEAAADGTWYIKNVGANYNGNYNQAMEYYKGFTTYGIKQTEIYQMQLFLVSAGEEPEVPAGPLTDGAQVVIYAPAYAMALSATPAGNYNAGVQITLTDGVMSGYGQTEIWTVTDNGDGTFSFTNGGQKLGMADSYASMSMGGIHDKWALTDLGEGLYNIKNTGRGNYMEWYAKYNNWSTYNASHAATDGQFQLSFYVVPEAADTGAGKLTAADQLVTGTYVLVLENGYAPGVLDGSWISAVQPVIEDGVVTDAKGGVWTLTVEGGEVMLTDSNLVTVAPKGGNNNGISSGSYKWSWTFDAETQTFRFLGQGEDTVILCGNTGSANKFRAYKLSTANGSYAASYPNAFSLYKVEKAPASEDSRPAEGDAVVIYNVSAQGVLAAQNDTESIENVSAVIADGKATVANGGVVFQVRRNGEYFRFYNETYGYLCSKGTGNNAYYSLTECDEADWTLEALGDGFKMKSRMAKYNGTYDQYLEYYADSYKTYSFYATNKDGTPADTTIYEFHFYPCANEQLVGGIVNAPAVVVDYLPEASLGTGYTVDFTVDAPFGVKELAVTLNGQAVAFTETLGVYTVTVPAEQVTGEKLELVITGTDNVGSAISGTIQVTVVDEPQITEVTPAAGAETGENKRPVITAAVSNVGEAPTVTVTLNGQEVEAAYADGLVTYVPTEDLAEGRTAVTVTVVRADGKQVSKSWTFTVGQAQFRLYFGQLHSHTTYSDGSGSLEAALEYIASLPDSANVDFVAFTDHSNYFDKSGEANPESALYDMTKATAYSQGLWSTYKTTVAKFNTEQGSVIAIAGFEMTWSGGPGHINTFNTEGIVSRNNTTLNNKTNDAGMKAYYNLLSQSEGADSLSQFNHPGSTFGTFTDFSYWDALVDSRIQMVEVGNGEGQIGAGGYYPSYEYYTMALDKGWHVAPTNNQDNHKGKWGNANDARDVILTDDFSEEGIYQAIRDMRMYATEDKNLEIYYTVNGYQLGSSIEEVPEALNISVSVHDPDASDSISKVEVIVNSGKTAYTWDDPAVLATGSLSCTLDPVYSYYYIRVTQGDGELAVTAPVWVGETLKLGISSVECATSTPVTGEELTLTTTLFNSENKDAVIKSLTYTAGGSQVVGVDTAGYNLPASGSQAVTFKYTPDTAKVMKITVTAVVEQEGVEYVFSMDISLDVQDSGKLVYIGIDASHYNEYVNGNYKDSMGNFGQLAAQYNVRTVTLWTSEELIAACQNASGKYKAIILTAPSRRSAEAQSASPLKVYTAEELAAINAFNQSGGTVILAGWSDHYENYPAVESIAGMAAAEHMAATQNAILQTLGSSLRIGDDATYDDSYNGGQAYRLYFNTYGESFLTEGVEVDAEHPHDRLYTEVFSHYGGASVYTVDGTLPASVIPVVYGHASTYSVDVDADGLGGESMPKYTYAQGDQRLMIMAAEQLEGRGLIIVSGAAFMSNFEVQATIEDSGSEKNYSNYRVCENLLSYLNPVAVTDIAQVQAQTETGLKFTVEGVVTSNASGYDKDTAFFDCIYVQDATGGVCCFPVAGNYKVGDVVRVTGTTEFYQGEMELQVTNIEIIGSGAVTAREVTAEQISNGSVLGQLISIKGTVVSFEKVNGLVQTIMVKDGAGDVCRVFIDGYITTAEDVKGLEVGCDIEVTGIASYDNTFNAPEGPFARIRIRSRADIVCTEAQDPTNPGTGDAFSPVLLIAVMVFAVMAMAGAVQLRRKHI